ncbi:MAG: ABC transporter permease subunit [Desulfobacterales bacterium]|nr:ABC transporter permease subunit [Desulfobacterales bacterium]
MRNFYAILRRELYAYFSSPIAYAVMTIFLVLSGYFFYSAFAYFSMLSMQAMRMRWAGGINVTDMVLNPTFSNMSVIMLLMMPLLTMRLFSEEKKEGTLELLLSYPIRETELLMGKFVACLVVFFAMLALTWLYPVLIWLYAKPDFGPIFTGYLGLFLMGAAFIALGLLVSSLTENQIVSAAVTFGAILMFWLIGWSEAFAGPSLGKVLSHLSLLGHFEKFAKGLIDTRDVIYYVDFSILFLFMTMRSLESKRWRG